MAEWVLIFFISYGFGQSASPKEGIVYQNKEDCMEQLRVIKQIAKENDGRLYSAYCKPKLENIEQLAQGK